MIQQLQDRLGFCLHRAHALRGTSLVTQLVKNPPANAGDARDRDSIPELGKPTGEGNGNPLQYSCLGNPLDRDAWQVTAQRVSKSWT